MRKISKKIMTFLTFSAVALTALPCSAAVSYDIITPISSTPVTCNSSINTFKSGSPNNTKVDTVNTAAVVDDPSGSSNKCYYIGTQATGGGHGIACGADSSAVEDTANKANGYVQAIYGVGTLTFDMLLDDTGSANNKATMMYLHDESAEKIGAVKFQHKTANGGYVVVTASESGYPTATLSSNTKLNFDTWYTCSLSVNVPETAWKLDIKEKGGTESVLTIDCDGFATTTNGTTGFRDIRFVLSGTDRPKVYVDNWYTTREQYIISTPVLTTAGGKHTATVAVKNESTAVETLPVLIVATYDATGKLTGVNWANTAEGTVLRNKALDAAPAEISLTCDVDEGHTAKAFLWNSLTTLIPYTTPVVPQ